MSERSILVCDRCHVEAERKTAIDWLRLDVDGRDVRVYGDWQTRLTLHFCSHECLLRWLERITQSKGNLSAEVA